MEAEKVASSLSPISPQQNPTSKSTASSTSTLASVAAKQRDNRKTTNTPAFLCNLGKATLRGIRKCPKCGVYNGTRGLSCKNKACGISLRNSEGRNSKKGAMEVVKLIVDSEGKAVKEEREISGVQVFSVCQRGRGLTQMGFVELVPTDTAIATDDGATLLTRINLGRCFMPFCKHGQKSNQDHTESKKQSSESICIHIKQAIECRRSAAPLTLKSSVLEDLQMSIKDSVELWRLATESPGPLVQRVGKDVLVVKCSADLQHPLGLLHLTVIANKHSEEAKRKEAQTTGLFQCACQSGNKNSKPGADGSSTAVASSQPCLHFYACQCAFASDDKLSEEFASFISYNHCVEDQNTSCNKDGSPEKPMKEAELTHPHHKAKRLHLEESLSVSSQDVDERAINLGFHQWLASVTERIHLTMHYHFNGLCDGHVMFLIGKPQPLVFQIPQNFFNALLHRLSLGSKKRRLPNSTTAFERTDGLPGTLSKYTWHITNPMHVKRIFDTPEMPLELSQSFVKNADGSYSRFHCPDSPLELDVLDGYGTNWPQAIRPLELRTFLKIGTADQKDSSPFVIEWIPNILPVSRVGELRISFEFGHYGSGQSNCDKNTNTMKGHNKLDSS